MGAKKVVGTRTVGGFLAVGRDRAFGVRFNILLSVLFDILFDILLQIRFYILLGVCLALFWLIALLPAVNLGLFAAVLFYACVWCWALLLGRRQRKGLGLGGLFWKLFDDGVAL